MLTDERVGGVGDMVPELPLGARSRESSPSSVLTRLSEMELDAEPLTGVQSATESGDPMVGVEKDSDSENERDDCMNGAGMAAASSDGEEDGDEAEKEGDQAEEDGDEAEEDGDEAEEDGDEAEEDGDEEPTPSPTIVAGSKDQKNTNRMSVDSAVSSPLATVELRRSLRHKQSPGDEAEKDGDEATMELTPSPTNAVESKDQENANGMSVDTVELRRSSRNKQSPLVETTPKSSIVVRRAGGKKDRIVVLVSVWNNCGLDDLTASYSGWPGGWEAKAM